MSFTLPLGSQSHLQIRHLALSYSAQNTGVDSINYQKQVTEMRQIQAGSEWTNIKTAASILWRASLHADITHIRDDLRSAHCDPELTALDLHTGINTSRTAVLIFSHEQILVVIEGPSPDELIKNTWTHAKGSGW